MTSVHPRFYPVAEVVPCRYQPHQFVGLAGVLDSNAGEHRSLVAEQLHVANRRLSGVQHLDVAGQRVATEKDALVGFGWAHTGSISQPAAPVNGVSPWW